jgi:replicative DNA helicase
VETERIVPQLADVQALPVPAHSIEAEQALLGALLLDPTAWSRIACKVAAADFYRADHRVIFGAIEQIVANGRTADAVTVIESLKRRGELETAGGLAYLSAIVRDTPTAANVEAYADVVRERAQIRRLQAFAAKVQADAYNWREFGSEQLFADALRELLALQDAARSSRGLVASRDLASELIDDLDSRQTRQRGIEIGLADFDELTCGLEPGDLVVIAGRPGMGKTALLVTIAAHVAQSTPVACFSAEMPAAQLMRRCVALFSGISQQRLRRADRLTNDEWSEISRGAATTASRLLWVDDTPLPRLEHVRAESLRLKARSGLGLILVDYVQLVQGAGATRYEQLRDVAYGFKALAKDLAVPVIVLAQLNRAVESRDQKRPHLSDLRDSGAIEEAADIVGLLYSEAYYDPTFPMPYVLECRVDKHRNGERAECLWRFDGAHSRITQLDDGARAQYRQQRGKQARGVANDL